MGTVVNLSCHQGLVGRVRGLSTIKGHDLWFVDLVYLTESKIQVGMEGRRPKLRVTLLKLWRIIQSSHASALGDMPTHEH